MVKKIFLLFILFISFDSVFALERCTPSKEFLEYEKLSNQEKKERQKPIYCSEIINNNLSTSNVTLNIANEVFPILSSPINSSYYNSFDDNLVNIPENQYMTGLCWDFSALSSVEINARKNQVGNYNFSEAHLAYSILGNLYSDQAGKNTRYNYGTDGGKITYAPTYFFNGYGQKLESEFPFNSRLIHVNSNTDTFSKISSSEYQKGNNIVSLESFHIDNLSYNASCTNYEINNIKDKIIKYGSVQATMFMEESLFSDNSYNYYLSKTSVFGSAKNHGVVIIGWDDSIPKSRFKGATRDGAWIVKNSWGSNWSGDGLFYISYDDEFICKMIATFSGVSSKNFTNTYKSSEVIGDLVFDLADTFYTSSKFTKQTNDTEILERVSFPVGDYMNYEVYLSLDNSLEENNWELLTSGESDSFGIESVDLSDIVLNDDFTIIVKYLIDDDELSSLFTTCHSIEDTSHLSIDTNTNYFSLDGDNWNDFANEECEPNIYAYTNPVSSDTSLEVNSIANIDDIINIKVSKNNVDTSNIEYVIKNSNNIDVTDNFTIIPNYSNNEVYVISDNTVSGTFTVNIKYGDISIDKTFKLVEMISSKSEKLSINSNIITVIVGKNEVLDYEKLMRYINVENTSIIIDDKNGVNVSQNNSHIGTGYTVNTNNNSYKIVVKGDANGDGKISALDYIAIRKHMIKSNQNDLITDEIIKNAVDMNNDGKISALDYIAVRKIMIGG